MLAQPLGAAASSTTGASTGLSRPAVTIAAASEIAELSRFPASVTPWRTLEIPRVDVRRTNSTKSASSKATSSAPITAACSSS